MRLQNASRYPDAEVRRLVAFGAKGINLAGVAVHVRNCSHAYAGRAYKGVPSISSEAGKTGVRYLVTLRVGASGFPVSNVGERTRWLPWETTRDEADDLARKAGGEVRAESWYPPAMGVTRRSSSLLGKLPRHLWDEAEVVRFGVVTSQPYGGKRSPVIVVRDWREAMVTIAAHEAFHIQQFRRNERCSEVACERFAAKALDRYRTTGDSASVAA